ncbi:hypothetical protein MKW98_020400, partial [Papaver atlanticum]
VLKDFPVVAEAEVRSLASLYSVVGRSADALALYFGEDSARCPFEQVRTCTYCRYIERGGRINLRFHKELLQLLLLI